MLLIVIGNILHVKCTDSTEEKRCVVRRRGLRYHLLRSEFFDAACAGGVIFDAVNH